MRRLERKVRKITGWHPYAWKRYRGEPLNKNYIYIVAGKADGKLRRITGRAVWSSFHEWNPEEWREMGVLFYAEVAEAVRNV